MIYLISIAVGCAFLYSIYLNFIALVKKVSKWFQVGVMHNAHQAKGKFLTLLRQIAEETKSNIKQNHSKIAMRNLGNLGAFLYLLICAQFKLNGAIFVIAFYLCLMYLSINLPLSAIKKKRGLEYIFMGIYVAYALFNVSFNIYLKVISVNSHDGAEMMLLLSLIIIPVLSFFVDMFRRTSSFLLSIIYGISLLIITYSVILYSFGVYNIQHFYPNVHIGTYSQYSLSDYKTIAFYGISSVFQFPSSFNGAIFPAVEYLFFWFYSFVVGSTIFAFISDSVEGFKEG